MRRYQGKCLIAMDGRHTMKDFDRLPPIVRERLRQSEFNICPACVETETIHNSKSFRPSPSEFFRVIESFEAELRDGADVFTPQFSPTLRRFADSGEGRSR